MEADLQAVEGMVAAAGLPEQERQTLLWCVRQLPQLYRQLAQTNESRHSDDILRLVQGMLKTLKGAGKAYPDAARLAEGITSRLQAMQERLGIPGPDLNSLHAPRLARPKKSG
jgi:hypothetical protein